VIIHSKRASKFLYYALRSPVVKGQIEQRVVGSTQKTISLKDIRGLKIPFPPYAEREMIGQILSLFDEKIELNRQMNEALETIGQGVFRRWFVDFEFPNEEGKPYKSSGGEIVDSSLGEIPKSWKTGGLGDICEITMGQSPPGETYNETGEGVPFFQGIRDFGFRFPNKRVYCVAPTRFARIDDVLLSVRAPVGSLNIADVRCAIGRGVAALRLKEKQNSFLYYLLLATRSAWDQYDAKGTVFGSATKQDVHDFGIIIPPKDLRDEFGELIEPLDQRILFNEKESRNLTAIRDAILPKLVSGKIRVPIPKENAEA
jgi:type I restriction enzyme S subunit